MVERINATSLMVINDPLPITYKGEILGSILYHGQSVPLIN